MSRARFGPLPLPPLSHLFDRKTIKLRLDGEFSVFEYNTKNALLFSQGDWSLIRRDLVHAGVDECAIEALEDVGGPCTEIIRAFRIRRELIHYKKVCLHLFEEARKIERELKQATAFFFWNDGENKLEGSMAHMNAIAALAQSELNENVSSRDNYNDFVTSAMKSIAIAENESDSQSETSLVGRKMYYVLATSASSFNKGVTLAIHDARNIAKAICLSPRHPDGEANGERPIKLRNLPDSLYTEQALSKAECENPFESRGAKRERIRQGESKTSGSDGNQSEPKQQKDREVDNTEIGATKCSKNATKGMAALYCILDRVRDELKWPEEAVHFLSLSMIARGGFKALAIVEELLNYEKCISDLPERLESALQRYKDAHAKLVNKMSSDDSDESLNAEEELSAAASRCNTIHNLRGLLKSSHENTKWVSVIASMCSNPMTTNTNRLFVAGDDASTNNTCMFVPKGFELGNFIAFSRDLLDRVLIPGMQRAIASESWPPPLGTRRTRILAFPEEAIQHIKIGIHKLQVCGECKGYFNAKWIRHGICSICETEKRNRSSSDQTQRCIFENCKVGREAFCPHFRRCFVCDAPHTCDQLCRVSRGNGEVAASLVETVQPTFLLLDFDRTLASTKSGASPLPKKTVHINKESHSHSIDVDLKGAVISQKAYGSSHVVTRNSHKTEIEEFLRMHGLEDLANHVHVVPKKMTKGSYIQETFFAVEENDDASCIFIDDDIRELVKDPWLRDSKQVHRLLFVRGLL